MTLSMLPKGLERPVKLEEVALRGDVVCSDRYTDLDYLKKEFQEVWFKTWNIGGMAYQMPEPGDYLTTEIGIASVIMTRQEDGSVLAYHNACPHRGMVITEAPDGNTSQFQCPYHGWQFGLDGVVKAVPDEDDFPQGSPCGKARLKPIQCVERFGFIWFNMDDNAVSLEEHLGEQIVADLDSYHCENMIRVLNITAEATCNWKVITDNFNESYHVQQLHPGLLPYITAAYAECQYDLFPGGHNRGWFPSFLPSAGHGCDEGGKLIEPMKSMAAAWGIDSDEYIGREAWKQLRLDVQKAKLEQYAEKGYPHYAHLTDYQTTDYVIYNVFPNNVLTGAPDGMQLLRPRPHPTDPNKCLFDHWWLVHPIEGQTTTPSPAGGPDLPFEDADHEQIKFGEKTLGTTADEDLSVASLQQRGLASPGFQGYYLPNQERRVQNFHEWLNQTMSD